MTAVETCQKGGWNSRVWFQILWYPCCGNLPKRWVEQQISWIWLIGQIGISAEGLGMRYGTAESRISLYGMGVLSEFGKGSIAFPTVSRKTKGGRIFPAASSWWGYRYFFLDSFLILIQNPKSEISFWLDFTRKFWVFWGLRFESRMAAVFQILWSVWVYRDFAGWICLSVYLGKGCERKHLSPKTHKIPKQRIFRDL